MIVVVLASGSHVRLAGEYSRPAAEFDLSCYFSPGFEHLAAGSSHHQSSFRRFGAGEDVLVELVPEPLNPYDGWAVALDIDGKRVAYLQRRLAAVWHDIVRACNKAGLAVVTRGLIEYRDAWVSDESTPPSEAVLRINSPDIAEVVDFAIALGLRKEHDAVVQGVSPSQREAMLELAWDGLSDDLALTLRQNSAQAPSLTWLRGRTLRPSECVPYWHIGFLRQDVIDRRDYLGTVRLLRRYLRRELKRREAFSRKEQALADRRRQQEAALAAARLQADGHTHREVAQALGISIERAARLVQAGRRAAPDAAVDWNAGQQLKRVNRGREALALQRSGRSRAEIGASLGCSVMVVKDLLADARFFEDPATDPARRALALACRNRRRSGVTKTDMPAALGASKAASSRAYRDASVLELLGKLEEL